MIRLRVPRLPRLPRRLSAGLPLAALLCLAGAAPALAAAFERPVPQAQTDVAEAWFAAASLALLLALGAVRWLVARR